MTIDKSLRVSRGLSRNRSVLTRGERLLRLKESDRWKEGDSPLGLPKVRVQRLVIKKKKKKKEEDETDEVAGETTETEAPAEKDKGKGKGKK